MKKCIFCKKQTDNSYTFYTADSINSSVREKITVFACTKCLMKKSTSITAIVLFCLSLFFLMALVITVYNMIAGEEPTNMVWLVFTAVSTFVLMCPAVYYLYRLTTDKPLSETSAAKELISQAAKLNPSKRYFTPAENELIPQERQRTAVAEKELTKAADNAMAKTVTLAAKPPQQQPPQQPPQPRQPQISNICYVLGCYDNDRVSAMSLLPNMQRFYSPSNVIAMVRKWQNIPDAMNVKYYEPKDWKRFDIKATPSSFDCNIGTVYGLADHFLASETGLDVTKIRSVRRTNLPYPNQGLLLLVYIF